MPNKIVSSTPRTQFGCLMATPSFLRCGLVSWLTRRRLPGIGLQLPDFVDDPIGSAFRCCRGKIYMDRHAAGERERRRPRRDFRYFSAIHGRNLLRKL